MTAYSANESSFAAAVIEGMRKSQKTLPPKFFYDRRGSELFDRICKAPEYYITRTEESILLSRASSVSKYVGDRAIVIEMGSGGSRKAGILLEALMSPVAYIPIDISYDALLDSSSTLAVRFPQVKIFPICTDFSKKVNIPWQVFSSDRRQNMAFFSGSTLGNFDPGEAEGLLKKIARLVGPGGWLLLGLDLVKSTEILNAAYNDLGGVTAAFNLNLLMRMRAELGAQLDMDGFAHQAFYNGKESRVEMHLVSLRRQKIRVLGAEFSFHEGETIHTENSYKYTPERLSEITARAGFKQRAFWTDEKSLFGVGLFEGESPK